MCVCVSCNRNYVNYHSVLACHPCTRKEEKFNAGVRACVCVFVCCARTPSETMFACVQCV